MALPERYIPHNREDEIIALGLAVLYGERLAQMFVDLFTYEDFHDQWHRNVYEAIKELVEAGQAVNPHAVWHRVSVMPGIKGKAHKLADVVQLQHGLSGKGDKDHLLEVLNRLRPLTVRRRIAKVCAKFEHQAIVTDEPSFDGDEDGQTTDPALILAQMGAETDHMEQLLNVRSIRQGPERTDEIAPRLRDTLVRFHEGNSIPGSIPTGIGGLDALLDGNAMQPQGMYVVSGPPGLGKTSLALSIGYYVANVLKIPVGLFPLEMSKEVVNRRLFSVYAGIPFWMMRKGFYGPQYEQALKMTETFGDDVPFVIDDTARSMGRIRKSSRHMVNVQKCGLIIVDYLQLVGMSDKPVTVSQRTAEVTGVSRELKLCAGETNVPWLVVSNMSREQVKEDRRPELTDLRESGQIEFDAEAVWFMFNQNKRKGQVYIRPKIEDLLIIMAKQRNGPTGDVDVKAIWEYMQILDADEYERAMSEQDTNITAASF